MKVLYCNTLYAPNIGGGAELVLKSIVEGFRRRGQDASVLTTHGGSGVLRERVDDVPVYRLGSKNVYWHFPVSERSALARSLWHGIDSYNVLQARQAGHVIAEIAPDLVVCHNLAGLSVAVWAECARRQIPVVQVLHDYYSLCPKSTMYRDGHNCAAPCKSCSAFRRPHLRASRTVSAVVGVSRAILDTHLSQGLFPNSAIRAVVHNARALPPIGERQADGPFTFGFIGGLTSVKGVDLLARAFASLARQTDRPIRLLIAGKGTSAETARLHGEHASPQITFVGQVDPFEFFARLDVAVVPSLWNDPFPGVAYEALGMGVPVIGARRGGIPEIVQHEVNGLLFDPSEPGALEACMARVLMNPEQLQAMRRAARSSVAPLLVPERVLDEYDDIYRRVTAPPAPSLRHPVMAKSPAQSLHRR